MSFKKILLLHNEHCETHLFWNSMYLLVCEYQVARFSSLKSHSIVYVHFLSGRRCHCAVQLMGFSALCFSIYFDVPFFSFFRSFFFFCCIFVGRNTAGGNGDVACSFDCKTFAYIINLSKYDMAIFRKLFYFNWLLSSHNNIPLNYNMCWPQWNTQWYFMPKQKNNKKKNYGNMFLSE